MRKSISGFFVLLAAVGIAHAGSMNDEIARKAQQHASATTAQAHVSLRAAMGGNLQPFTVTAPAGICDPGTADLVVHDDGSGENGYGWNAVANVGRIADKFTPATYPATISTVCAAFITNAGVTSFNFNIVVYAADGTGGAPGTQLGSKALVGHPASIGGLPFTPTFETFDISDLALNITSGDVYISIEWDAAVEPAGVYFGVDESTGTALNGGYMHANSDPWAPIVDSNAEYRAMLVRAVMPIAGPGAPSLSKSFAPSQVLANVVSTLTIKLNNASQPTAAVLSAALTDTFPTGLLVATTPNASTTCTGGTVTAVAGSNSVSLASGASIPASGSCTISVDVTAAADGQYANSIAVGALQTQHGNNPNPANATLKVGFVFPEPYCPVTFPSAIEPITRVVFANIDNATLPSGGGALEDFTAIVGNVAAGEVQTIAVEGNTAGSFTTPVAAYIDWNQDGTFDPVTEHYTIGSLVNSTGADGQQVSTTIAIPVDAASGNTRMRVIKKWNAEAPPCNNAGYGQAEDYTLNIAPPGPEPKVAKAFAPTQVLANAPSTLTITLKNLDNTVNAVLTTPFTDAFPPNLVVAAVPNASTTCPSGTVTANAGAGSVSLGSGAVIPAGATCLVKVDVSSAVDGTYVNTIPVGALVTDQGDNPFAASASIKIGFTFPEPYCPVTFPSAVEPITHVLYAGIDNSSSATVGGTPALENFTAITGAVMAGRSLSMTVEGNTAGAYSTPVVAFADWNQNGVFDVATERYPIGTLTNSTGADGKQVSAAIAVPVNALPGSTRLRVLKKYSTEADPCNNAGFGQGEDYTLTVSPPVPYLSKAFSPASVYEGVSSTATITLTNPTANPATLTAPLVDNLPAGLNLTAASTTCGLIIGRGGAVIQASSITLPAGIVLPAGGTCTITATVNAPVAGSYVNLIAAGGLQTNQGNSPEDASATLTVSVPPPVAQITPTSLVFTLEQGDSVDDEMIIANIGGGSLIYDIAEAPAFNPDPPSYKNLPKSKYGTGMRALDSNWTSGRSTGANRFGAPVVIAANDISQMSDNSPGDEGVACNANDGSAIRDNSWWRRFYFNEHPSVGATTQVQSVTISTGSTEFPGGLPATINLYTTPHSVAVNTIDTAQLTLIGTQSFTVTGSLVSITVPVLGSIDDTVAKDLVVEWHTDGATGSSFYPGANATPQTHPTFISSTACSITTPTDAANVGSGFPDFHLTMVVALGSGTTCDNPSSVSWLSASPSSGTIGAGASNDVVITADATGLAAGTYEANLCVTTNDPTHALVPVPVTLTVNLPDAIFCSTFDDGDDGSCGGPVGPFTQPIEDPSFEATTGDAGTNPEWGGVDSNDPNGGTPFYSGTGFNIEVHTGDWEVWFGGWRASDSTQTVTQSVPIASGGPRFINYWRKCVLAATGGTAVVSVYVDGTLVDSTDMVANGVDANWVNESIDISSYADNGTHEIKLEYVVAGASDDGNIFVDDVTIDAVAGSPRPAH